MPSTYPRMRDRSYPNPHPPPTPNALSPHTPSTPSSRFLSPIQESRILSWRAHTTPLPLPDSPISVPKAKEKGSKSAPATLDHNPSCTSSSHASRDKGSSAGQSVSRCSCTSSRHQHHTQSGRPGLPPRHTVTGTSQIQESSGQGHRQHHQMRSYYSSKKKSTTASSTPTPQILSPPMSRGSIQGGGQFPLQHADQQQAPHGYDTPMGYTQTAPQMPPGTQMQPPPLRPDPPRIAGARDPISQN